MATLSCINNVDMPAGGRSVRPAALSALHSGNETRLALEVERLLLGVVAMGSCCIAADLKRRPLLWSRPISGRITSISLPSGVSTGSPRQESAYPHADGSTCSLLTLSCGHMKGRPSGPCAHYSSWYTPNIPTLLPALTRLQPPCTYPGLSNARWQSDFHHRAGPASAPPGSWPR
jgi:hypothetical protein